MYIRQHENRPCRGMHIYGYREIKPASIGAGREICGSVVDRGRRVSGEGDLMENLKVKNLNGGSNGNANDRGINEKISQKCIIRIGDKRYRDSFCPPSRIIAKLSHTNVSVRWRCSILCRRHSSSAVITRFASKWKSRPTLMAC